MSTLIRCLDRNENSDIESSKFKCALEEFEAEFSYPLGADESFRISHGEDYSLFYRAMGPSRTFVAMRENEVLGTVSASLRTVRITANEDPLRIMYIGDLKVKSSAKASRAAYLLLSELHQWGRSLCDYAFSIVMDGTATTPETYTGRLGLPRLQAVRKTYVFQLACNNIAEKASDPAPYTCNRTEFMAREEFNDLSCAGVSVELGNPRLRSIRTPIWLTDERFDACGCLEDTLLAKCLRAERSGEIRAAHLSGFAYDSMDAALLLLKNSQFQAASQGFTSIFFCIDESDHAEFRKLLINRNCRIAPATIYANEALAELASGKPWFVHSSEI